MNILLWVIQALLAILFLLIGVMKCTQSVEKLATTLPWVNDVRQAWPRFIGACEILGALGLVLPGLTHIQPWLTVVAAGGLAMIMVDAAMFHSRRREFSAVPVNITLFLLAVLIVYGRWVVAPLT